MTLAELFNSINPAHHYIIAVVVMVGYVAALFVGVLQDADSIDSKEDTNGKNYD